MQKMIKKKYYFPLLSQRSNGWEERAVVRGGGVWEKPGLQSSGTQDSKGDPRAGQRWPESAEVQAHAARGPAGDWRCVCPSAGGGGAAEVCHSFLPVSDQTHTKQHICLSQQRVIREGLYSIFGVDVISLRLWVSAASFILKEKKKKQRLTQEPICLFRVEV